MSPVVKSKRYLLITKPDWQYLRTLYRYASLLLITMVEHQHKEYWFILGYTTETTKALSTTTTRAGACTDINFEDIYISIVHITFCFRVLCIAPLSWNSSCALVGMLSYKALISFIVQASCTASQSSSLVRHCLFLLRSHLATKEDSYIQPIIRGSCCVASGPILYEHKYFPYCPRWMES